MTEKKTKSRSARLANWGILFSTLGVIVLLVAFYVAFMQLHSLTNTLQQGLTQTNEQLQQANAELNKQAQGLTELRQLQMAHPGDWRIAEAQYLVKLAHEQLQFTQNTVLAQKLLEAANDAIGNLTGPTVDVLRKALAQDIARLQNLSVVNTEATYLRLIELDEKLNRLPLPTQPANSAVKPNEPKEDLSQLPWWKRGLYQTWQSLQKIVVVQHTKNPQIPFVTPEQREFIYLNLHAKLETAIWGLLHHQSTVYQNSLAQISQWVARYFVQDQALTQTVLTTLTEMQKINVQFPNVSVADSLQAFQLYFQSQPTR